MRMRTIAAGRFKATCLAVMDEVAATREPVEITKRGRRVARLAPLEPGDVEEFLLQQSRNAELGGRREDTRGGEV